MSGEHKQKHHQGNQPHLSEVWTARQLKLVIKRDYHFEPVGCSDAEVVAQLEQLSCHHCKSAMQQLPLCLLQTGSNRRPHVRSSQLSYAGSQNMQLPDCCSMVVCSAGSRL